MNYREIDVKEEEIESIDSELLKILLKDRSTGKNIIWATTDYSRYGKGFRSTDNIKPESVLGRYKIIIRPRVAKHKYNQEDRTREKAEVFTPAWLCNRQNNLIDQQWFGRTGVFNSEKTNGWKTNTEMIVFPNIEGRTWKDYVNAIRLEVTCGEAPYLVSRYDAVSGNYIEVYDRVGLLDRKLRVISENIESKDEWCEWAIAAYKSIYAYEFQGDSLLLARENLLFDFIDNYSIKYGEEPSVDILKEIATIISWNVWQMDGITNAIPFDKARDEFEQISIFDLTDSSSPKTKKTQYAIIKDWANNSEIEYRNLIKKGSYYG